jgi:hypothetical protein
MKLNKFNKIQTYKDYQLHPRITIGIKWACLYNLYQSIF